MVDKISYILSPNSSLPVPFLPTVGKKNSIDTTDLRHMLKRKAVNDTSLERRSAGKAGSSSGGDRDNKRRRKERDEPPRQVMTGKGRQADNKRKKQHGKLGSSLFCIVC